MSDDEIRSFIEEQKSLQVGTLNRDGSIHLTTLWFGIVDDEIVFETFTKSQKVLNLQRDPRISVLLEDGLEYEKLRGVSIQGRADLYSDPADVEIYARAVAARTHPDIPEEGLDAAAKNLAKKRSAVVVKPEKIISWDHSKLGGGY